VIRTDLASHIYIGVLLQQDLNNGFVASFCGVDQVCISASILHPTNINLISYDLLILVIELGRVEKRLLRNIVCKKPRRTFGGCSRTTEKFNESRLLD